MFSHHPGVGDVLLVTSQALALTEMNEKQLAELDVITEKTRLIDGQICVIILTRRTQPVSPKIEQLL